jgi:hypothetical protein
MARPFDFDDAAKNEARFRQYGFCADCGRLMHDLWEHAHHVIPNQSGMPGNPNHAWLRTAINCVVLCENCHYAVHDSGRYQKGAVAPPGYYEFSHGKLQVGHKQWVDQLNLLADQLWGPPVKKKKK